MKKNKVAIVFEVIGYVEIVLSILICIYFSFGFAMDSALTIGGQIYNDPRPHVSRIQIRIAMIAAAFFSGMLFIGFAEIIKILNKIEQKAK